jgi:hypothetical protein
MDDLIEGLVGSVFGIVLLLALGAVFGAGWLLYKFCEVVLPPLFELLADLCTQGWRRLAAWYRAVTWKRRMVRAHDEAIREIAATRRQQVALCQAAVEALESMEMPTASQTAAVRVAVRGR